jgi:hypothetical protein
MRAVKTVMALIAVSGALLAILAPDHQRLAQKDTPELLLRREFESGDPSQLFGSAAIISAATWFDNFPGRELVTRRADWRTTSITRSVIFDAHRLGFSLKEPKLLCTKPWTRGAGLPYSMVRVFYAKTDLDGQTIIYNATELAAFTDEDLQLLAAHELGHAYDFQTHRKQEHSFVGLYRHADMQRFADGFAAYLYGQERVDSFNLRLQVVVGKE